jgi:hypothetical protein
MVPISPRVPEIPFEFKFPPSPFGPFENFENFMHFFFWAINRLSILYPNGIITHLGYLNLFEFYIFYFGAFAVI